LGKKGGVDAGVIHGVHLSAVEERRKGIGSEGKETGPQAGFGSGLKLCPGPLYIFLVKTPFLLFLFYLNPFAKTNQIGLN
jgi:hypothetical protein